MRCEEHQREYDEEVSEECILCALREASLDEDANLQDTGGSGEA